MTKDIKSLVWIGLITLLIYGGGFWFSRSCGDGCPLVEGATLGVLGIFTFFSTIFLVTDRNNFANNCFDDGEYRKAITATVFIMFFGMIGFGAQPHDGSGFIIPDKVFSDFTFLVELIAGFYFGSRTVENVMSNVKFPSATPACNSEPPSGS